MLSKDHIHTEYLLTFDMKCNETELCGLSLVLVKDETPKLFPLLHPFLPFDLSYPLFLFHLLLYRGRFLKERISGRLVTFFSSNKLVKL